MVGIFRLQIDPSGCDGFLLIPHISAPSSPSSPSIRQGDDLTLESQVFEPAKVTPGLAAWALGLVAWVHPHKVTPKIHSYSIYNIYIYIIIYTYIYIYIYIYLFNLSSSSHHIQLPFPRSWPDLVSPKLHENPRPKRPKRPRNKWNQDWKAQANTSSSCIWSASGSGAISTAMAPARGKSGQSRPENDPRGCKKGLGYSAGLLSLKLVPISNMSMSSSWKLQIRTISDMLWWGDVRSQPGLLHDGFAKRFRNDSRSLKGKSMENQRSGGAEDTKQKSNPSARGAEDTKQKSNPSARGHEALFLRVMWSACPFVIFCDKCQCVSSGLRVWDPWGSLWMPTARKFSKWGAAGRHLSRCGRGLPGPRE